MSDELSSGYTAAVEVLEAKAKTIMEKAVSLAEDGNVMVLNKLIDKILPNLSKTQNLTVTLTATNEMLSKMLDAQGVVNNLKLNNGEPKLHEKKITTGDSLDGQQRERIPQRRPGRPSKAASLGQTES